MHNRKSTFKPAPAKRKLAKMVTIKPRDDFVILQFKKPDQKLFFMRERDGSSTVIWSGDDVEVESFGSTAERRALHAKHFKESEKRRVALILGKKR
jgi:hypothetical protein